MSVYGIRHSCVLGACSPEELAALTSQVRLFLVPLGSETLAASEDSLHCLSAN